MYVVIEDGVGGGGGNALNTMMMSFASLGAVAIGVGVAGLLQSSTATALLAVSFAGSGLIAVVRADAVGESSVKVLTVGGRAPGSADYPLQPSWPSGA